MLGNCIENVRKNVPLVHNITNYVTVNDVANMLLACGGSPIMSAEPEDVEDITSICGGLNINIGTLTKSSIEGMFRAGKKANELNHVILLDPVGAGASALRTNTALQLMEQLKLNVIRGNISEIKTLALGSGTTKGVDADVADAVTEETLDQAVAFVRILQLNPVPLLLLQVPSTLYPMVRNAMSFATADLRWARLQVQAVSYPV